MDSPTFDIETFEVQKQALRDALSSLRPDQRRINFLQQGVDRLQAQADAIQATRPPGCWCLGAGGRGMRYLGESLGFREYCACEAGAAAKLAHEREATAAAARKVETNLIESGIPFRALQYEIGTSPADAKAREAASKWCRGAIDSQAMLLTGDTGRGKTGLAVGMLHHCIRAGSRGLFVNVPDQLARMRDVAGGQRDEALATLRKRIATDPLVVFDDIGVGRWSEWVEETVYSWVNARYEDPDLASVFTTNCSVAELGEHIGARSTWRIVEMCGPQGIVKLGGRNLRMTAAAKVVSA